MVIVIKKTDSKRVVDRKIKSIKISKPRKKLDAYKYLGTWKLKEDPNLIQKKMRDEWD